MCKWYLQISLADFSRPAWIAWAAHPSPDPRAKSRRLAYNRISIHADLNCGLLNILFLRTSMSTPASSTHQRLIQSALELFTHQGVSGTTTRQIADRAEVNEVTLFRQFGNKHGLLLAVLEESTAFQNLGVALIGHHPPASLEQTLRDYARDTLGALDRIPEFVRSVIGEADQYPPENRRALGQGLTTANRAVAQYLHQVIQQGHLRSHMTAPQLASLLNSLLLGYAVVEFTTEFHGLWSDRDAFLDHLVALFLQGAVARDGAPAETVEMVPVLRHLAPTVADLPETLVHQILQRAKKTSAADYGLCYVLLSSGLSATEVAGLGRAAQICDANQHVLQVATAAGVCQLPVNQWVLGKRYGSYTNNPLTKWLRSRKDSQGALFLENGGGPIGIADITARWQVWTEGLLATNGQPPTLDQAQQTWCVEMLMRGISLENLQILTHWRPEQLRPYAQRAREKVALEQALRLDQKPGRGGADAAAKSD
jgi:AcrR family transcriptional regulator